MDDPQLSEYRIHRVLDLVQQRFEGSKAALGRALGYRDGAFIGQMLRGDRPITEKTIGQINRLPGCTGWFNSAVMPGEATRGTSYARPSILDGSAQPQINERRVAYRVISIEAAIEGIANHLESVDGYDKPTVISLLTTLANSPDMHAVVAAGLKTLKPQVRGDPSKHPSPAHKAHGSRTA